MIIANATGCSSIYGGNLPTTPFAKDLAGRGPAWSNSLFEDNAEFGFGMRLGWERQNADARRLVAEHSSIIGDDLVAALLTADQTTSAGIEAQRGRVARLKEILDGLNGASTQALGHLRALADELVTKSVWIIGGDGWAYDIGYGGLDHVLSSGYNVNVLVLDTEVYSNTGGQASKATPRGAAAKFAASGKGSAKKDLGAIAQAYGNVYVAHIAIGANDQQTIRALQEADAWDGPSIVIAYSTCIAHGIEMSTSMSHQKDAVRSGYWPLYRYRPGVEADAHPLKLDSKQPSMPVGDFMSVETRFSMLVRSHPERAQNLLALAQSDADERWRYYSQLAGLARTVPHEDTGPGEPDDSAPANEAAAGADHKVADAARRG
jgi:pyruvate-ferredoxin/flavodoxin oxidoreductase